MREEELKQIINPKVQVIKRELIAEAWRKYDLGMLEEAMALARRARIADPNWVESAVALGWFLMESGDDNKARPILEKAIDLDPEHAIAHWHLGTLLYRQGNSWKAEELLRKAIHLAPHMNEARVSLAWLLHDVGQMDDALEQCRIAATSHEDPHTLALLGWLLCLQEEALGAVSALQRALELAPTDASIRSKLVIVLTREERFPEAMDVLLEGLKSEPDNPDFLLLFAQLLLDRSRVDDARRLLHQILLSGKHLLDCWWMLGQINYRQQRWEDAEACLETAIEIEEGRADILDLLARVLVHQDRLSEAEVYYEKACEVAPEMSACRLGQAKVQCLDGRFSEAAKTYSVALSLSSDRLDVLCQLARCRMEQGFGVSQQQRDDCWCEAAESVAEVLRADPYHDDASMLLLRLLASGHTPARYLIRLMPRKCRHQHLQELLEWAVAHSGNAECMDLAELAQEEFPQDSFISCAALYIAAMSGACSHAEMLRRSRAWGREFALSTGMAIPRHIPTRLRGDRLRVAYIASHLHGSLLFKVLAQHDRSHIEVLLYTDDIAAARAILGESVVVLPLSDSGLSESLTVNAIDIVVDTVGLHPFHGQYEVLRALRQRAAPVQCGWLGTWGGGSGLYDVLIVDEQTLPASAEHLYDEQIIRIPGGQWAWTPPLQAPEPGPLPFSKNGHITFGTAVRGFRLTPRTLDAWAQALDRVPHSRLELLGAQSRDWRLRADFNRVLEQYGINLQRISYRYSRSYTAYLDFFQGIDIYLDAFPGNGGLGSLDSLWMGVPVVSCATDINGDCWVCERQGLSLLHAINHSDWAALSKQEYVSIAAGLAADPGRLMEYRAELRHGLLESPLLDGRRIAAHLESAWHQLVTEAKDIAAAADVKTRCRALAHRQLQVSMGREFSLEFPRSTEPDISVVIVLYNQAGLTLQALSALAEQCDVSIEIIIVDNNSSDETEALLSRISGARVLRNSENTGFLQAANQGAATARGRSILFLNNDVILQKGALRVALQRLQNSTDIAVVGGRIVLADGSLQEAGCITFSDGSTIGYGRGQDPEAPEFQFVRDIDFCSGAFLLVDTDVWQSLGGLDTKYAPAYYEDTDFCLRVREVGYRVVYEPNALMLHVEGGSAPEGEPERLMRHNQEVFLNRHNDLLSGCPLPGQADLTVQRWCAQSRPRILVVDDAVPYVVAGSGFVRARLLIQALNDQHVTLFPFYDTESDWRTTYESLPETVEVMLGSGRDDFEGFLKARRGVYSVLLVSRPPNMAFIAGLRSKQPDLFHGMHIVYDSEAIFTEREIAGAALAGKPLSQEEQSRLLEKEMEHARHAERVLATSQQDAAQFRQAGFKDVRIAAHAQAVRHSSPHVDGRSGMLFVGALNPDTPNEDGLLWFVREVMPRVREGLPLGITLSIVGECRSNKIASLESPDVQILGRIDDLTPLYDKARLFVAPVRYAAGVPAKVIEAAGNGLPVVASAILSRQLGWKNRAEILAAGNSEEFAAAIIRLSIDDTLWLRIRRTMQSRTAVQFAPETFVHEIRAAVTFFRHC